MTDHAAPLAPSKPRVDSQWRGTGVADLKLASLSVETHAKGLAPVTQRMTWVEFTCTQTTQIS